MTAKECVELQKQHADNQFEELMAVQEKFITSLRLDLHSEKFKRVMKEEKNKNKYFELSLKKFSDELGKKFPELASEIPALEESQYQVETLGRCYMYGRVYEADAEILKWRYYPIKETDEPLVGYIWPDPNAKVEMVRKYQNSLMWQRPKTVVC
ncbi:hypothetical protein [Endozoicomonas euniceicola]|uniref:Uncharacterized protein n=1 Tax=Endozoicomonas euniceicola TaxID=1234143 RepID=A0ABY6GQU6_9GAMM|nr:hypothetical protein [Endozoicomonas euniceicola]UYM15060.1 hypothetical protein NX720_19635 [Endozoicomonas euniceicola]